MSISIASANLGPDASRAPSSAWKEIKKFLSDPNDAPPYGYQDNAMAGIGFWMMQGTRVAISLYEGGANAASPMEECLQKTWAVCVALLTSPFTLAGALMKGIGSRFPHRVENLTIDAISKTPPAKVDQIYDLLQIVNALLRENHIDYSMDGGTLLGAVRHKGIIPWDDDGDLFLMGKDKARFLALSDKLREKGVILQDTQLEAFKLSFDAETLKRRYGTTEKEAANVDVFIAEEDSDGIIRYKSHFHKHQFPKEYFYQEELQHRQDYPFGPPEKGLVLRGPANPRRYLDTFYGPECFDYAIQTHSHIQVGPLSFPILNFSKTRYKIVNPTYAKGKDWK